MNNNFAYGSVFKVTRRDTPADIERHFSLMKQCGMDTVVVWPAAFWWEDKTEDYPFHTGKVILEIAERLGLKIIMELAGQLSVFEYIPDFMMKKEYHPVDSGGHREWGQSSFGFLNYFHPEVDALIRKHFAEAAAAYRDCPTLLGYDVFNETMFRSFDSYTIAEFRLWLREKYGTIEALNEVWERTYSDFEQIEYEQWKWMSIMPEADWNAFKKASIGRFLRGWCDAVRKVDPHHMLIADNIHSTVSPKCTYDRPQDDFDLKRTVGEIGMSFYPKQMGGTMENALRHEVFDGFYAASKREGFFVSEMQTHIQALHNQATCVRPAELTRWCLEAYAAGAKGLIWWMWRPFDKGLQTLGRGLVDYRDRTTERYDQAKKIGELYRRHGVLTPLRGRVGVLYDPLCDDFGRIFAKSYNLDASLYTSSLFGAYKALFELNCPVDIITLEELSHYRAVILSNHRVLDKTRAAALRQYVAEGGTLIIDGRFGLVDDTSLVNADLPGGECNDLCGMDLLDADYEGLDFNYGDLRVRGYWGRELVRMTGGEAVGAFDDGYPAASRVQYGRGTVLTINTYLWYGYTKTHDPSIKQLAARLLDELSLSDLEVTGNAHVRVSENSEQYLFFIFNYTAEPQEVRATLRQGDKTYTAALTVAPGDSIVVAQDK